MVRAQLLALDGASPNHSATWALASGEMIQSIHMYMQFGWAARDEIIHVSDHPVAPSTGLTASIVAPLAWARLTMTCHVVPAEHGAALERRLLVGVERPVLADERLLLLEQGDRGVELLLVERVRVGDAEIGLRGHQVHGGVGDVDRAVVHRHGSVGRRAAVEHDRPTSRARRRRRPRCCRRAGWRHGRAARRTGRRRPSCAPAA